jgi:transposase
LERTREKDFTLRGLVAELAARGLKVDYRSMWNFVHAEKLSKKKTSWPANAIGATSRAGGRSGKSIRAGSSLSA